MRNDNYKAPASANRAAMVSGTGYASYDQVPVYRRQWFFWISYFLLPPVALALLFFGDIYYVKKGRVVGFGIANRIVAGAFLVYVFYSFFINVPQG